VNEEAAAYLVKAEAALEDARVLAGAERHPAAIGRAYYAMLHAAQALLVAADVRFRKHAAVHAAFGRELTRRGIIDPMYHQWLIDALAARQVAEYGLFATVTAEQSEETLRRAAEFIVAAGRIIAAGPIPPP